MHRLNQATVFAASMVLTVFGLTWWGFEEASFDPPMTVERVADVSRQADGFGGMFGIRGPHALGASAEEKQIPWDYEHVLPAAAVSR